LTVALAVVENGLMNGQFWDRGRNTVPLEASEALKMYVQNFTAIYQVVVNIFQSWPVVDTQNTEKSRIVELVDFCFYSQ